MDAERPKVNYSIRSTHLNLIMVSFHIDTAITATAADGTHPTGMQSCFLVSLWFCQSKSTVDVMGKWTCK